VLSLGFRPDIGGSPQPAMQIVQADQRPPRIRDGPVDRGAVARRRSGVGGPEEMPLSIAFGPAWLTRDARIVITTRALRTFGYGSTSVVLAAMLTEDGDSPAQIGLLLAVAAIGSVLASILMGLFADRFGRRSSLLVLPGAPLLSSSPLSHLVAEFLGAGTISTFPRLRASTTPGVPLCLSSRRVRGRRLDRGGSGK
jgi:hypothetical protein